MPQESHADKIIERFKVTKTNNPFPAYPSVEFDARREDEETAKVTYREEVRDFYTSQELHDRIRHTPCAVWRPNRTTRAHAIEAQ